MDNRAILSEEQEWELRFWQSALRLNTSIPAIIDEFDVNMQRVSATPAIKAKKTYPDGKVEYIDYPKITNIPIAVQRGNGLLITRPFERGKLCTLIFSQRSIDNLLLDSSKPAKPFVGGNEYTSILRCMSLTDAMCFPGIITNDAQIQNYNNNAVEIRNEDGTIKISVSNDGLTLQQEDATISVSGGDVEIEATNIKITGTTVMINGKNFDTHIHSGVESGTSNTGGVVA